MGWILVLIGLYARENVDHATRAAMRYREEPAWAEGRIDGLDTVSCQGLSVVAPWVACSIQVRDQGGALIREDRLWCPGVAEPTLDCKAR